MPPMTKSRTAIVADEVTADPIAKAASRMLSAEAPLDHARYGKTVVGCALVEMAAMRRQNGSRLRSARTSVTVASAR